MGFTQGAIGEYVYDNNRTLSRLNWNLTSLWYNTEDIDNHVHRNPGNDIDFYGDYNGIIYFNAHAGCTVSLHEALKVAFTLQYEYVPEQKGDTYYINTSTGIKSQVFKN